jgi:hypothetical protein
MDSQMISGRVPLSSSLTQKKLPEDLWTNIHLDLQDFWERFGSLIESQPKAIIGSRATFEAMRAEYPPTSNLVPRVVHKKIGNQDAWIEFIETDFGQLEVVRSPDMPFGRVYVLLKVADSESMK